MSRIETTYLIAYYDSAYDGYEYFDDEYETERAALAHIVEASRPPYIETENLHKVRYDIVLASFEYDDDGQCLGMCDQETVDSIEATEANKLSLTVARKEG